MPGNNPRTQAQQGLALLKEAIIGILTLKTDGLSNAEIADLLDIRSDYQGYHSKKTRPVRFRYRLDDRGYS